MSTEEIARNFLEGNIQGLFDEIFDLYVSSDGRHHNLWTPAGMDALKKGMQENHSQFPHKQFEIKQVVCSGGMVVTYSHLIMEPNTPGMVVMHMFRMEDGKIVELWDCGQAIPTDSPNLAGAF